MIKWDEWVNSPGLAPYAYDFETRTLKEAKLMADKYIQLLGKKSPSNHDAFKDYFSHLKVVFVERLIERKKKFSQVTLKKID